MVAVVAIAVLGGRLSGNDVATSPSAVGGLERHHWTCRIACTVGRREPDRSGSGSARGSPRVGRPRGQDRRDQRQARVGAVQRARIRLQDSPPRVAGAADHGVRRAIHSGRLGCGDRRRCRTDDVSSRRRWLARLPRGPRQRSRRADDRRPARLDDRARRSARRGPRLAVGPTIPMPCPDPPECAFTVLWAAQATVGRRRSVAFGHPDDGRSGAVRHRDGVGRHDVRGAEDRWRVASGGHLRGLRADHAVRAGRPRRPDRRAAPGRPRRRVADGAGHRDRRRAAR